jgi:hypothetical protein
MPNGAVHPSWRAKCYGFLDLHSMTGSGHPYRPLTKGSYAEAQMSVRYLWPPQGFANRATLNLRFLQKSQIEGCKHQDNADVHYQSLPESIPKDE